MTGSDPISKRATQAHSCQRCAVRKIKCDKQTPCGACTKYKAECEFRTLPPPRRKRKADRNDILAVRSQQYKRSLVQKDDERNGSKASAYLSPVNSSPTYSTASQNAPNFSNSETRANGAIPLSDQVQADTATQPVGFAFETKLVHEKGRSKFLDNGLWTRVVEELADPEDAIEHSSDEDNDESAAIHDNTDFLLGLTPASISIESSHPPPNQILELWQVFLENVDPLTKILHPPTLRPVIEKATRDLSSVPRQLEALLFGIYSAAVISLKEDDCLRRFGESRQVLASRYRSATKAALTRAKFLGSSSLSVLQALILHLLSSQAVYDPRTLWTLTGVALRIAESMGIHRDGLVLQLPVFETEIRRRVWWQLNLLNGDVSELSGHSKFGTSTSSDGDPKHPANVDDKELYPGMSSLPETRGKATDMVYVCTRYNLRSYWSPSDLKGFANTINNPSPDKAVEAVESEKRDQMVNEFEAYLEGRYGRYCDPSNPIQFMTIVMIRAAINTTRLIIHHPRRWKSQGETPQSERDYVWDLSLKGLRQYKMIFLNPELSRFSWHAPYYFRYQPFLIVLDTLRANPLIEEASQAWQLVREIYECNPDYVTNTKKPLYMALGNLCLKAYHARKAALEMEGLPIPLTPPYIKTLSKQRGAANRTMHNPPRNQTEIQGRPTTTESKAFMGENDVSHSTWVPPEQQAMSAQEAYTLPPQAPLLNPMYNNATLGTTWPSDYWDSPSGNYSTFTEDTNLDLDSLLASGSTLEDPINQTIDWTKWDALLTNFG
ncbi:hypothetical protein MMC25_005920 [Agyrium rufum]|nr:hypothetical protein [Agyrium rufum]